MQDIPHVNSDMAESWDASNEECRHVHDPIYAHNPSRLLTVLESGAPLSSFLEEVLYKYFNE